MALQDTLPNPPHDVKVVVQIVNGSERAKKRFVRHKQVTQIGPGEGAARVAATLLIHR